jgi:F-type H+-transporting ATPase subunit b
MVNVDGSIFVQIVNFLFLIWVLNVILYKPIRNVLLQRKGKITGLESDIQTCSQESRKKKEAFSSRIKEARNRGLKEKDALLEAAANEEKEMIRKINEKAAAEMSQLHEKIAKDAGEVQASLLKDVDIFAKDIGLKILGRVV